MYNYEADKQIKEELIMEQNNSRKINEINRNNTTEEYIMNTITYEIGKFIEEYPRNVSKLKEEV